MKAGALAGAALVAVAVQGAGLGLPTVWLAAGFGAAMFFTGGIGHGVKNVLTRALIQERVPGRYHGRAFAAYNGMRNGAELVALAWGGVLVVTIGARGTLALAGAISVLAALGGLLITLSVLPRLDGERKGVVLRFLDEAGLIRGLNPKIRLWGADLRHVALDGASLYRPALRRADLRHASFRRMVLYAPDFYSSDLRGADFSGGTLDDPDFSNACLSNVSFRDVTLNRPLFRGAAGHDLDFTDARGGESFRARPPVERAEEDRFCVRQLGSTMVG